MTIRDEAKVFVDLLRAAEYRAVLTGAGVSTASGIPDFRSAGGLYSKISQETFELDFLLDHPEVYYKIAIEHIHPLADRVPNVTHRMLAELEKQGLLDILITQNIDGLHQKAGSENVVEFHGNVVGFHCIECGKVYERLWVDEQIRGRGVPQCHCGSLVRPEVVFFGDPIPMEVLMAAQMATEQGGVFAAMGTSLKVQPAASLAVQARRGGAKLCIVNREATSLDSLADFVCHADLTEFSQAVMDCP
jgi:NAD-dependent deacetylase